jgi:hypothetical protein
MKTSRGYEVTFCGIATAMDELLRSRPIIKPPTYRVEIPGTLDPATGKPRFEEFAHDSTTLETPEQKADYARYLADVEKERISFNERALKLNLLRGIKVDMPDLEQWRSERKCLGLPLPTDPNEEKFIWIYTEVIGTVDDLRNIQEGVANASGVSEEKIAATAELFRYKMGQSNGETPNGDKPTEGEGDVVLQHALRTGEGSTQDGRDGERVRRPKRK